MVAGLVILLSSAAAYLNKKNDIDATIAIDEEIIESVRKVAWEHLSEKQKSQMPSFLTEASVRKVKLNNGVLSGTKYDNKEVYLVDFISDGNSTFEGIGAYVSTDTNEFIEIVNPKD